MANAQPQDGIAAHPTRRRASPRWWLAGLLVGCLLPAGLSPVDAPRLTERIVQICILAPALMRVRCRREARRRTRRPWPARGPAVAAALCRPSRTLLRRWPAAHDVLTRRGPPVVRC